jgi:hypothetical protein
MSAARRLQLAAGALLACAAIAARAQAFSLSSPDLPGGRFDSSQVFKGFGCEGGNVSPALSWRNAPAGTKSFAVTLYDLDAPTGSGWWHWVVFNIPRELNALPRGAGDLARNIAPTSVVQSRTDYGIAGYGGPCPPPGDKPHRYLFTVHALSADRLDLDKEASGAMVGYYLWVYRIAQASFTARYAR